MQMAIDVAGFTPAESDRLRQAMGSKRSVEKMEQLQGRLYEGMARAGHHRRGGRPDLRQAGGLRQLRLPREPLGELRLPRLLLELDEAATTRRRSPPGCSTASPWGSGRPRPSWPTPAATGWWSAGPTSTPARPPPPSSPARTARAGPRCASASSTSATWAGTWPSGSRPAGPMPTWRTWCAGPGSAPRPPEALATAGAFGCFSEDRGKGPASRREALWGAGALAQSGAGPGGHDALQPLTPAPGSGRGGSSRSRARRPRRPVAPGAAGPGMWRVRVRVGFGGGSRRFGGVRVRRRLRGRGLWPGRGLRMRPQWHCPRVSFGPGWGGWRAGHRGRGAALAGDDRSRVQPGRSVGDRPVARQLSHRVHPGRPRRAGGGDRGRPGGGGRPGPGDGRRDRHPPPAAGDRPGHHLHQPGGRNRPDQCHRAPPGRGPVSAGWPGPSRRCSSGGRSRRSTGSST